MDCTKQVCGVCLDGVVAWILLHVCLFGCQIHTSLTPRYRLLGYDDGKVKATFSANRIQKLLRFSSRLLPQRFAHTVSQSRVTVKRKTTRLFSPRTFKVQRNNNTYLYFYSLLCRSLLKHKQARRREQQEGNNSIFPFFWRQTAGKKTHNAWKQTKLARRPPLPSFACSS